METGLSFFGRKGSPRAGLCLLSPAPTPPNSNAQCVVGWIKGKENRSWEGNRCLREVGEESQFSNSHSPTIIRAWTSSLLLGLVPGAKCHHLHPQFCFHFTDGRMGARGQRQLWHQEAELGREGVLKTPT